MGQSNNTIATMKEPSTQSSPEPEQTQRPLSRRSQLEHILNQLSAQDLRTFIINTALQDEALRETLLVTYADLLSSDQPEEARYQECLYKILTQYTNKDGYISYKSTHDLTAAITALLNTARKATTPVRESVDLCTATISVMPKLGEKMDDSEGYLYELIGLTCTILLECFDTLKPEAQQDCFQRVLALYAEPEYLDLDLDSFLLELLQEWAKNDKSRQAACLHQQEKLLKTSEDDQWRKNYLLQQTNKLLSGWAQQTTK